MRLALLTAVALAFACIREEPPPSRTPASDKAALESLRAPRDTSTEQISGLVTKREGGAVMLDSGGPNPIPLRVGDGTQITLDGKPGTGDQIREGDLVRAAYKLDNSGEPFALQVVANSKPPATETVQPPAQQQPAQTR